MRSTSIVLLVAALILTALLIGWQTRLASGGPASGATLKLFKSQCSTCHGLDGKGQTTAGKRAGVKDWTDGKTLNAMTDADIGKRIREGKKGDDGKQKMPAFKKFSDAQVDELIQYVRTFQRKP